MSLMLAPYNDAMRLGMGFNSYTQTMCIDGAVDVQEEDQVKTRNTSQVVTYSSQFVEQLSDIVSSLNVSYSSSIKKGTIEVAGNSNAINEDKIKESDLNLVVSVQVVNQTTVLKDSAKFQELSGMKLNPQFFNDVFGDCYISGFIEGGNFSSIISIRSLDRSKTNSVVQAIKQTSKTSEAKTFSMDAYSFDSSLTSSDALQSTETTVTVNWMGGGRIKDPKVSWDIPAVYAAAAAFPDHVAKTPQRTWAILTKYKANRSYNEWALINTLPPLEYDAVLSYTAELFNNFMEYKQLIRKVQDMLLSPSDFPTFDLGLSAFDIPTAPKTKLPAKPDANSLAKPEQAKMDEMPDADPNIVIRLVALRNILRNEMNKIVAAVDVLSRKPHLLEQASRFDSLLEDPTVRRIMTQVVPSRKLDVPGSSVAPPIAGEDREDILKIDPSGLIAPEVWAYYLPLDIEDSKSVINTNADASNAAATLFPPAPKDDAADFLNGDKSQKPKFQLHAAVAGLIDVSSTLRNRIVNDSKIEIRINEISQLAQFGSPGYAHCPGPLDITLSLVYQLGDGPILFAIQRYVEDSSALWIIDSTTSSIPVVPTNIMRTAKDTSAVAPNSQNETAQVPLTIIAVAYALGFYEQGAADVVEQDIINDPTQATIFRPHHLFQVHPDIEDPRPGFQKTSVVFYRVNDQNLNDGNPIRAAVSLEEADLQTAQQVASDLAITRHV